MKVVFKKRFFFKRYNLKFFMNVAGKLEDHQTWFLRSEERCELCKLSDYHFANFKTR